MANRTKGLKERLQDGEKVIVAEGYLFELERRGYLSAGPFLPEVVLEHPDKVKTLSEDFVHAGSDVVLAFTYYANREKFRLAGRREEELEKQNMDALRIARQVADNTGTLMAGNLSNTTCYDPDDPTSHQLLRDMFKEQVLWAVKGGSDLIITETMGCLGEAKLAVQAIKDYGNGLPIISNLSMYNQDDSTVDGVPIEEAARQLEAMGVTVVGLNCFRGPATMPQVIKKVKDAVKIPVSCIPVCYRTSAESPGWNNLKDADTGGKAFPNGLDYWHCSREQISAFTRTVSDMGVQVLGLCCGNAPHYTREMAEALGRTPPASKYSPDMADYRPGIKGITTMTD